MDIFLDLFDDYAGDRLYANLFPVRVPADGLKSSPPTATGAAASLIKSLFSTPAPSNDSPIAALPSQYASLGSLAGEEVVSRIPRDNIWRQFASLYVLTLVGIFFLYFIFAGLSYWLLFDKRLKRHPRFLKNQVRLEIQASLAVFPQLAVLTVVWFLAEVRGHSLLYDGFEGCPWGTSRLASTSYMAFSSLLFLVFTDLCIYWIHRMLHWPAVYKRLHKPHHKWIIPTPFASHAFHPLDGYAQSLPYHWFVFMVPLEKHLNIGLFFFVNLWSIGIHDSDMITNHPLENVLNSGAHHTLHHMYFNVNYGQYFTWADKHWKSHRQPTLEEDPVQQVVAREAALAVEKQGKAE